MQLKEAVDVALRDGTSLSELLVRNGHFEEKELLGLVAHETGVAPVDLDRLSIKPDVAQLIPKEIAEQHMILPVAKIGHVLTVAVSNPFDVLELDHLRLLLKCDLRLVLASERALKTAARRCYSADAKELEALVGDASTGDEMEVRSSTDTDNDDVDLTDSDGETSPVIKLTNMFIANAIREGASDIHIEPFETKLKVRYRQDGILREVLSPPRKLAGAIASRIKIMASLDIAEKRKPQDGKFQVKMEGRAIDFRVSTLPVVHGEKIVMRVLDNTNLALGLETLGFEDACLADFTKAIRAPYGMILITGPTGSGKSTTLYSAVKELYSEEINFVTVEDPVEYQLEGINQVPVNPKRGVTFATALRAILRQDPDTILIGEIRDAETVEIAVKAALTGHLVLSTLHTNDAASAITRMSDMGLDPFLVATSVLLVAAQRLCRKLCPSCREEVVIPTERLRSIGFSDEEIQAGPTLYRAVGCGRCHQGYRGRFAVIETLKMSDPVRELVLHGKSAIEIKKQGLLEGMVTLRRSAIKNAIRGTTSLEEVLRVTMSDT
ncbi:MAG: ATPase, T2SS/T4P/T4SS family [Planctomycetota bacterium]